MSKKKQRKVLLPNGEESYLEDLMTNDELLVEINKKIAQAGCPVCNPEDSRTWSKWGGGALYCDKHNNAIERLTDE